MAVRYGKKSFEPRERSHNLALGVLSRHLVERVCGEPVGSGSPSFAADLIEREALECLDPVGGVKGLHNVVEVLAERALARVVKASDRAP